MSVQWLTPIALAGLVLVALPIAIHLLVREQTRRVLYPSLRFLRQSQLAAFRRRSIQDAALLACRVAILAVAALALAGPVLQTASRQAAHAERVATAVIVESGADSSLGTSAGSFVSKAFTRREPADAIAEALLWLEAQPPASREIAFAGTFNRGELAASDLLKIPSTVGIRFARQAAPAPPRQIEMPVLMRVDGSTFLESRAVRLEDDRTEVSTGARVPIDGGVVRILAMPADQALADAALRAALSAGIRWPGPGARALVVWPGVEEAGIAAELRGATLVRMERPAPLATAASAVSNALAAQMNPPMDSAEPVQISDEQLRAWSRPPGPPPATAPLADEGDRRWLWAAVLALLALEYRLRKSRADVRPVESSIEARVA